jgi:D-alanine transaminase
MIVYLNGEFLPLEEARVPVLDRGFIFGDGVYEVIPVYNGQIFKLAEHLQRLENSLNSIKLVNPFTTEEWTEIFNSVVTRNDGGDRSIYLQVTRGVAKRDHQFPEVVTPTIFVMSNPLNRVAVPDPITAITCEDIRWKRCDIKSIALLPNILQRQAAVEAGAYEAILIRDGFVTEGAASNVFIVENGVVITPPKSNFILPGITRDIVLEIMPSVKEENISEAQLRSADEIWITSSTREILPVISLDNQPVGTGEVGSVWSQALQLYKNL